MDTQETKLATYSSSNFSKICLGTKFENQFRFIIVNKAADSLHSLIADGTRRSTSVSRAAWRSLFGDASSLEQACNTQGFNVVCQGSNLRVRIGIITNDLYSCYGCSAFIGYGGPGNGCMNRGSPWSDNGNVALKAMGYILIQ